MKCQTLPTITLVGFGAQAKAWALNYRDSGGQVNVLLRESSSSKKIANDMGFQVFNFESRELNDEGTFCLLCPDNSHDEILLKLTGKIQDGATFIYAHGYSYAKGQFFEKFPQYNHLLLAPKAIASEVRFRYESHQNIMAAFSMENSPSWSKEQVETLANALGFTKLIETSFEEETKADLFSEQTLLCSLLPYGALHSYNKLREKGVNKELAFIECWMEVLLIAKAMVEFGPKGLFELISPNALIGGEKAVSALFNEQFMQTLDQLREDVWSGSFYNHVDHTDFPKLKDEVIDFWENQEIQKVYEEIKHNL